MVFCKSLMQGAEAVHPRDHDLPVDGFFRRAESFGADLVAISARHLEAHAMFFVVELQLAEQAGAGPLPQQILRSAA